MTPRLGQEILYLSRADVVACGVTPGEMNQAVAAAFEARARGEAWTGPKLRIGGPGDLSFQAKSGALRDPSFGALKWYGYGPSNAQRGLPDFHPLIVLNEGETGLPVAILDGTWISEVRTGSITAVAATHLARPDARSAGFVACGAQARGNLVALLAAFPLRRVVAHSRSQESAEAFAEFAAGLGVQAEVARSAEDAIAGVDIVVTSVPPASAGAGFLDAGGLASGTFVSMVDLGFSWRRETLGHLDRIVTDVIEQGGGNQGLNLDRPLAGGLDDLMAGRIPGRWDPGERLALIFAGTGLADAAAAALVFQRARERGLGLRLPL